MTSATWKVSSHTLLIYPKLRQNISTTIGYYNVEYSRDRTDCLECKYGNGPKNKVQETHQKMR